MYDICSPGYRGRCTAPLLVDRRARRIVSNESAGIVRNLNAVSMPGCSDVDLVPPSLTAEIDVLNEQIYDKVPCFAAVLLRRNRQKLIHNNILSRAVSNGLPTNLLGQSCKWLQTSKDRGEHIAGMLH